LGNTKKTKLACELCMDTLDELGCKIPRNTIHQTMMAVVALQKVKDIKTDDLHSLPRMRDSTQLATMSILNSVRV